MNMYLAHLRIFKIIVCIGKINLWFDYSLYHLHVICSFSCEFVLVYFF